LRRFLLLLLLLLLMVVVKMWRLIGVDGAHSTL